MRHAIIKGKEYRYIGTFCSKQDAVHYSKMYKNARLVHVKTGNDYRDYRWPAYNLFVA